MTDRELHNYWDACLFGGDLEPFIDMRQVDFTWAAKLQFEQAVRELTHKTNRSWTLKPKGTSIRPRVVCGIWELEFTVLGMEDVSEGNDYRAWRVCRIASEFWRPWMSSNILQDAYYGQFPSVILHSKMSSEVLEAATPLLEACYEEALIARPD